MHSERDFIVKTVVPVLRQFCNERRVHLVEIDMRWGITAEDAASGQQLQSCLREVEQCDIFVALIGHRYGWVPAATQVPDEVKVRYEWMNGASVLAMEIRRALKLKKHCVFFLRETETLRDQLPTQYRADFFDTDMAKIERYGIQMVVVVVIVAV
jgi:hypothetical protein